MGLEMKRCRKCGAMDTFPDGVCSKCGFIEGGESLKPLNISRDLGREGREEAPSLDALAARGNVAVQTNGSRLSEPELWMYILSCFYPILQYILMGVYVLKGDTKSAFNLWLKPLIAQIVLAIAAIIIIALMMG